MKIHHVWISLCLLSILTVIKAQRMTRMNKPIVDLNAKPQITTTPKLPEERRKMSIFPKNMAKFVITSKPYSKVRTYSPWEISTKKPLMQKLVPNEARTSKMVPVTRPSVRKFTSQPTTDQISKEVYGIDEVDTKYLKKENNLKGTDNPYMIFPNGNDNYPKKSKINNRFVSKDFEPDAESTDEVSNFSPKPSEEENQDTITEASTTSRMLELENSRQKRLSVQNFAGYNNIDVPSANNIYSTEERKDNNEFIFVKDKLKAVENKAPSNYFNIEEDMEIATEVIWLEEYSRPQRSINIIEEENLGTTIAGFKFTGREPQVNSYLIFKNINA